MDNDDVPKRILIRAGVQQIPGAPDARPWNIWELFCTHQLHREVRTSSQQPQSELGFDEVHVLPNFDSPNDVKAYFLTDVGVKEGADQPDLTSITFEVYRAAYDTTNEQWYVSQIRAKSNTKSTKEICTETS